MTTGERSLREIEQLMLARRPWDAAEDSSIWVITGVHPGGAGRFTECLAITLPTSVTGSDQPLFAFLAPLEGVVGPAQITHAVPLLLVHRDEPRVAYWADEQKFVDAPVVTP